MTVCEVKTLPADKIVDLVKGNTLDQFQANVIGANFMGYTRPLKITLSTGRTGIVIYNGKRYHKCFNYLIQPIATCCKKVYKFNIDHYYKCYLPNSFDKNGNLSTPYTYNRCQKCNVSVVDTCGRSFQTITNNIKYFNGFNYFKANKILQDCNHCGELVASADVFENKITYNNNQSTTSYAPVSCSKCQGK